MKFNAHTKLLPSILLLVAFSLLDVNFPTARAGCLENAEWATEGRPGGRTLLQVADAPAATGSANVSNNYLVLAQQRTERRDPLNNFNTYRGGWDVKNEHYWASVGYTGIPGFILAAAWLLLGLALFLLMLFCCCCCGRRLKGAHQGGNVLPLIFLLLFTAAAVAGCVLVYIGQGKLHNELSDSLDYVVQQSKIVVVQLRNTSAVLGQSVSLLQVGISSQQKAQLQQLDSQLNTAANTLESKTQQNADNISTVLNRVRLAMIVVAGVMLLLVLLGFLFSTLGMTPLMYMLVILVWILVVATWLLCGVYIMLNNVVGDTCVAMKQWVANPSAQTSLQDILPCVDVNTTDQALNQSRSITNDTVTKINTAITTQLNPGAPQPLPVLCNPLQPNLSAPGCVNESQASQVWAPFVCNATDAAARLNCPLQGRLTPQIYSQFNNSVSAVNSLDDNLPFLFDLANCQFVRQVFTTIQQRRCRPLRKYLKWQYVGLALISGGFMFSIWLWIVFNRRRKHIFFHHNGDARNNPQFMSQGSTPLRQQTPPPYKGP